MSYICLYRKNANFDKEEMNSTLTSEEDCTISQLESGMREAHCPVATGPHQILFLPTPESCQLLACFRADSKLVDALAGSGGRLHVKYYALL
jgi:hypothetical protein